MMGPGLWLSRIQQLLYFVGLSGRRRSAPPLVLSAHLLFVKLLFPLISITEKDLAARSSGNMAVRADSVAVTESELTRYAST